MNTVTKKIAIALMALGALLVPAAQASAAQAPAWRFDVSSVPTNLVPGSSFSYIGGETPDYLAVATNVGTAPTKGPVTITDTLPAGLTLKAVIPSFSYQNGGSCSIAGATATCVFPGPIQPGEVIYARIGFDVDGTGTILHEGDVIANQAIISGGGTSAVVGENTTEVSSAPAPFEFLPGIPGFGISPYAEDGTAETQAGGHPHVLSVNLAFSTTKIGRYPAGVDGGERNVNVYLPHGAIVNPTATPRRCGEVQLEAYACPANSQNGVINIGTSVGGPTVGPAGLYNMEPAPGKASNFGFVVVFYPVHIEGGVR
ncbi:MAG TPA: hypothetical protein VNS60_11925, partial [Solirubrobacterales bacterium]|nr:hypothetical protein [Solirubrobacterales bacterium]